VQNAGSLLVSGLVTALGHLQVTAGTCVAFARLSGDISAARNSKTDQRDRKPLDRSSGRFRPTPHNDGTLALSAIALFLAGMTLGGFLVANKSELSQLDEVLGISTPDVALPIAR
jgi:hypothetical protein